ncbi:MULTISPECIES: homoserine dehydrogenase [unclassified Hydrogenobaculum]|jgi:homoserine dehydrogenase (EC 1.1.1.3)|uniref:homoserine dehydrogenase n=1 Tax=unclassified Hydrogenobaculum TaxID=2622382 RepID=UPI0001C5182C|nr:MULTISPECIES: homoserine dehydrogenase [unclassified Hydrogenobaculum]AEF19769.1 homoserine dehydrogenase [Hydrogenobaculum sp. 3684]AEG47056.1 homoserine dehydrogenase [Hydrogenobaculum sp. SHO]AGG15704.1 homoserine dehydrogenase [Hydrogenobaculum sp. HO]AGH94003.1 homoserine dehydrogenase [Hydrogenobaculum sp. SN]
MYRVGIAGYGTVGTGVAELLITHKNLIKEKTGLELELSAVLDKDWQRERPFKIDDSLKVSSLKELLDRSDIVVELIGGVGFAKELIEKAIENKKHVVSANKHLIAIHGKEIFEKAKEHNVSIEFEASVGGGIPIIKALKEGLVANKINYIHGILNGTTNYILTSMLDEGKSFEEALKEAKALGYAEQDPTFDIEGIDAAHKIAILSSIAYGGYIDFNDIYIEGISNIDLLDVELGKELGYTIKLLAIAKAIDGELEVRVHPTFINHQEQLAKVSGVYNAILIDGDFVGKSMLYGKGAGSKPTASAVVSDIIDIAKNTQKRFQAFNTDKSLKLNKNFNTRYYIRFEVEDKIGVLASIANVFAKYGISIASVLQKEMVCKVAKKENSLVVPLVILTHKAYEKDIKKALKDIEELSVVKEKPILIRLEEE